MISKLVCYNYLQCIKGQYLETNFEETSYLKTRYSVFNLKKKMSFHI